MSSKPKSYMRSRKIPGQLLKPAILEVEQPRNFQRQKNITISTSPSPETECFSETRSYRNQVASPSSARSIGLSSFLMGKLADIHTETEEFYKCLIAPSNDEQKPGQYNSRILNKKEKQEAWGQTKGADLRAEGAYEREMYDHKEERNQESRKSKQEKLRVVTNLKEKLVKSREKIHFIQQNIQTMREELIEVEKLVGQAEIHMDLAEKLLVSHEAVLSTQKCAEVADRALELIIQAENRRLSIKPICSSEQNGTGHIRRAGSPYPQREKSQSDGQSNTNLRDFSVKTVERQPSLERLHFKNSVQENINPKFGTKADQQINKRPMTSDVLPNPKIIWPSEIKQLRSDFQKPPVEAKPDQLLMASLNRKLLSAEKEDFLSKRIPGDDFCTNNRLSNFRDPRRFFNSSSSKLPYYLEQNHRLSTPEVNNISQAAPASTIQSANPHYPGFPRANHAPLKLQTLGKPTMIEITQNRN